MRHRRVLLRDIAERAGLTINTVSRALKNKDDISLTTRMEIQRLAVEMGYIPDAVASSLRSGSTKIIGVMYDNIANPYFMIMTEIIHHKLHDAEYELMIYTNSGDHSQLDIDNFNLMASRRLDGIITFLKPTHDVVTLAKKNSIPIVIIGREGEDIQTDSVYTDDLNGGFLMGEYLYQQGHKNVGYIGVAKDILCSLKRAEGFEKFYMMQNIKLNRDNIIFMEHYVDTLHSDIDNLIKKNVTGIFCFNDSMAYEAMVYVKDKYPEKNIEITGYDYIGERLKIPVSLTTISANKHEMVDDAIKALRIRIENPDAPLFTRTHETKLIKT